MDFSKSKKGVSTDEPFVRDKISSVETFAAHIANAMHSSEQTLKAHTSTSTSLSSQLRELTSLLDSGALTAEEFSLAKTKLLM